VIAACHRSASSAMSAHATEDMGEAGGKNRTKTAAAVDTAVSGSKAMGPTPLTGRQITPDHARAIAGIR